MVIKTMLPVEEVLRGPVEYKPPKVIGKWYYSAS